ncbi:Nicotinate-nucleotide adenylyltransferase [Acidisarcina polymorpha]|uniref:Probable nicotinate-nucleotide adenylyltransferase n=1 Tax=Acidisarcina polymorpha TaxID=2211140 RepID=A0A2Z5FXU3_9BACT|nr:nicotinate (nicotinamide) nucleotide adenylyltransferase [Acidisarcina polymorpha]AXC11622.1 Nicotinate-nucleotide adenylyltransferase [Acidisarcina polymorpha]
MRIAIFGGSFDPPHRGHLAIARAAVKRLALDVVWMTPAGTQPFKIDSSKTTYDDRLAMVRLAVADEPHVVASDIDAPLVDGHPNYTVDLLRRIRAGQGAEVELYFLLGADAFLSLKQWHCAEELPFLCRFIVAGRPGSSIDDLTAALPDGIDAMRTLRDSAAKKLVTWELRNQAGLHSELYLMPDLQEDISATDIRAAICGEHSKASVLAPSVLRYIEERGLYC